MVISSVLAAGLLVLTFDDASYDDWLRQLPLFARYDAHVTFFPSGTLSTNEVAKLKRLDAAGHTIGLHTVHHRDADRAFREEGWATFARREVNPQLAAASAGGLKIKHMAYPNNRHSPLTDAWLAREFTRFRAGIRGMSGYHTNGTSIVTLDRAFFPVADLPKHRVLCGTGVGLHYATDIDDLCRGIRRAAERDEVFVLYSHDISDSPCPVGMRTEWLEKLLATAKECGVPVRGFKELDPPASCSPAGPMTVYLTFDDGIKDHLLIAAGELEKRGWRGIFCIVTDQIGTDGKLTWDDVRELQRRGHVIANHTREHKSLGGLCRQGKVDVALKDILEGAERLERETGRRPTLLCLPGTDGDARVTDIARTAGLTTMLVPRVCFGAWPQDVGASIDFLRGCGLTRADFLVHGVCKQGGGWMPFETREDFIRYLDGVKAAEKAGKVVVSSDYANVPGLSNAELLSRCLDTSFPGMKCATEHEFADFVRRYVRAHGIGGFRPRGDYGAKAREDCRRAAKRLLDGTFTECGFTYRFPDGKVDWRHNPTADKYAEWTWQFNRHGFLQRLAHDYRANGDEKTAAGWMKLLESWMDQAPCPPDGKDVIRTDVCWRTIDTGMRLDEWTRTIDPFVDSPSVTDEFLTRYFASLWENAHFLTSRLSSANWLIHELEGLLDVALAFPFFRDAPAWRQLAERRLVAELTSQVYPDGFQIELCPGYHGICLDKYIRMSDLYRKTGGHPPDAFRDGISRMFGVYVDLASCRGAVPPLNDSGWSGADGLADVMRRAAALFPERADFRYFATGGREGSPPPDLSRLMPYAGAVTFRSSWQADGVWAYLDASPFGAGHQHEDKLNFLLEAYGKRMLTEGGVFAYDKSAMRAYVLSSRAHNTVTVDGKVQDRRSQYRWRSADLTRRAPVVVSFAPGRDVVEAVFGPEPGERYRGTEQGDFEHRRRVVFVKDVQGLSPFFLVVDRLAAKDGATHTFEQMWHVDLPGVALKERGFAADYGDGVSLVSFCADPDCVVRDWCGTEGLDADGRGLQGWLPAPNRTKRAISTPVYEGTFAKARRVVTLLYPCRGTCPVRAVAASADVADESVELVLNGGRRIRLSEAIR